MTGNGRGRITLVWIVVTEKAGEDRANRPELLIQEDKLSECAPIPGAQGGAGGRVTGNGRGRIMIAYADRDEV